MLGGQYACMQEKNGSLMQRDYFRSEMTTQDRLQELNNENKCGLAKQDLLVIV